MGDPGYATKASVRRTVRGTGHPRKFARHRSRGAARFRRRRHSRNRYRVPAGDLQSRQRKCCDFTVENVGVLLPGTVIGDESPLPPADRPPPTSPSPPAQSADNPGATNGFLRLYDAEIRRSLPLSFKIAAKPDVDVPPGGSTSFTGTISIAAPDTGSSTFPGHASTDRSRRRHRRSPVSWTTSRPGNRSPTRW